MAGTAPKTGEPESNGRSLRLRDQAYQRLRRLLILQEIPANERIREPFWTQKLGVNRMALREAFARLEAEGLIERGPKTGYIVPRLSDEDLMEVAEVRFILEAGAIDLIVAAGGNLKRKLAPLKKVCDEMERLSKSRYILASNECDRRFHELLVEAAENARLSKLYQRAPLPMLRATFFSDEEWFEIDQSTLSEHLAILEAIYKGDAAGARHLLREHLSLRPVSPRIV